MHEGLEAAIAEAPDQREPYLVYADWLLERGDPRGKLITLQAAGSAHAAAAVLREFPALMFVERDIELGWYLGFIESIRVKSSRQLQILTDLFAHPSGRFVQQIALDEPEQPGVMDFIRMHAPRTLARIMVGRVGTWTPPADLAQRFPRMNRAGAERLADAVAKASTMKLKVPLSTKDLPDLGISNDTLLVGLRAELDKRRPIGLVDAMKATMSPTALDAWALALADEFAAQDIERWAFEAIGLLGGDGTAGFLGENFSKWSHQRAVQALERLQTIGSPAALTEIVTAMCRIQRFRPRRLEARTMLVRVARDRKLANTTQLIARSCPIAPHPSRRASVVTTQRWWLYDLMLSGARLTAADFRDHVVAHPVRAPLAETLVWGAWKPDGKLIATFDGIGRRIDGRNYAVADDQVVGVIHPVELPGGAGWNEEMLRRKVEQTVLQLGRPTFTTRLPDYSRLPIAWRTLESRLGDRDWHSSGHDDYGRPTGFERHFDRGNVSAIINVNSEQITHLSFVNDEERVIFADLPLVTRSEIIYDLEAAVGDLVANAPTTQIVQPAAQPTPAIIEKAKTGRSKCVVCELAIPKDALRIGVTRMIETPQFKGRGTVWAHAACKDGLPELAGVTLDLT